MSYIPPNGAGILLEPGSANTPPQPPVAVVPGYFPPVASSFTTSLINHPSVTITDGASGLVLQATPQANNAVSAFFKALPTSDWSVAFEMRGAFTDDASQGIGLALQAADTTKPMTVVLHETRGQSMPFVAVFDAAADGTGATEVNRASNPFRATFLRVAYAGSSKILTVQRSIDGDVWVSCRAYTLTNTPGFIGPAVFSNTSSADSQYMITGIFSGWIQSW